MTSSGWPRCHRAASAAAMGARGPTAPRAEGAATGEALAGLGVDVDLAPVLDLADAGPRRRALGIEARRGRRARDRVRRRAPGRGGRSDREALPGSGLGERQHRPGADRDRPDRRRGSPASWCRFEPRSTPASSWSWSPTRPIPRLTRRRPASQSPAVIEGPAARPTSAFDGVVVTDDLDAGALIGAGHRRGRGGGRAPPRAGADLILTALSEGEEAHAALTERDPRRQPPAAPTALEPPCARTTALRARLAATSPRARPRTAIVAASRPSRCARSR